MMEEAHYCLDSSANFIYIFGVISKKKACL